ncbi:MAG: sulfatase [Acidobacteriia bacterium]|nr:sulfatase [Terriglobia bacterium]
MMTRRQALSALGATAIAGAQPARPNIVFILVDDLRWDALGCAGHPFARTPHIDRIAREGARFRNAFVTTPLCSPSRGCFLTGRYVHAHGVTGNGDNAALSHQLITFPRLLHDAGYETGCFGKWHMGTDDSPRPGFDQWVSFIGQGRYDNPPMNINGKRVQTDGYMTDLLGGHAVDFLRRKREKPFCLYMAHKAVHGPFTPAERHKSDYSSNPITRSANAKDGLSGKPALTRMLDGKPATVPGGGSSDELIRNQLRCMNAVDDSVGAMLKALEETGQLDNTLVLFTSDNGYFWGEHGLGDKRWAYEESIRIPMIARFPGRIAPGSVLSEDVLSIDIAPTMLDLARVRVPSNVHGRSILPLFGKKQPRWRQSFLFEYFEEKQFPRTPSWQGVRTPDWKYVRYTGLDGMDELYHLESDPLEMKNLIGEAGAKSTLEKLTRELARQLKASV